MVSPVAAAAIASRSVQAETWPAAHLIASPLTGSKRESTIHVVACATGANNWRIMADSDNVRTLKAASAITAPSSLTLELSGRCRKELEFIAAHQLQSAEEATALTLLPFESQDQHAASNKTDTQPFPRRWTFAEKREGKDRD